MQSIGLKTHVMLSAQRALLGMIYPAIRAIAIGFQDLNKLTLICYLDKEPSEDDYQNLSEIAGYILADINFEDIEEHCIYTVEPMSQLNSLTAIIYMRQEPL